MRYGWPGWIVVASSLSLCALSSCGGKTALEGSPQPSAQGGQGGTENGETPGQGGTGQDGDDEPKPAEKIDLLFMIDNSASMGDKQAIFAHAIPELLDRLTNPVCVDNETDEVTGQLHPNESCEQVFPGSRREFPPITDIHIGVITSSLGGVGADTCSPADDYFNETQADMARLITRGKDEVGQDLGTIPTYQNQGFLNWDPAAKSNPPGESDLARIKANFAYLVRGVDQSGCGYEMSLEAWRRFLVDPVPYETIVPVPCFEGDNAKSCRGPEGVDPIVLQQRKDFLRQDSLVTIVMLTDENDCSVVVGGQYSLALQAFSGKSMFHLARGTKACESDPWSPNCKSCWEVDPISFPECAAGWDNPSEDDHRNLRCFEQKRRFGIDFLYPVRRYIDALSQARFEDDTLNPLFCNDFVDETRKECKAIVRDRSRVLLAGIVGVPWVDIANDPKDLKKGFRSADQLAWTASKFVAEGKTPPVGLMGKETLWNMILGEVDEVRDLPETGQKNPRYGAIIPTVDPLDPLMTESVEPRSGTHPITGQALVQPDEMSVAHEINGSERIISDRGDLQYACVFKLPSSIDCTLPENVRSCDCALAHANPVCYDEATGTYGYRQFRAKAYPGRRQLAVLKGLGDQAVVASICPANTTDVQSDDYGYRPAINAIIERIMPVLQSKP